MEKRTQSSRLSSSGCLSRARLFKFFTRNSTSSKSSTTETVPSGTLKIPNGSSSGTGALATEKPCPTDLPKRQIACGNGITASPSSPAELKDLILGNLDAEHRIHNVLSCHTIRPEYVPVMVYRNREYGFTPTEYALDHDLPKEYKQEEARDIRLRCQLVSGSVIAPKDADGTDFFLPLGNLVERSNEADEQDVGGPITNYVWALNVSTTPHSLWLIYDYVFLTEEDPVVHLATIYSNIMNESRHRDYTDTAIDLDRGFLELGKPWDIVQVFDDVKDWDPENPGEPKFGTCERRGNTLRAWKLKDAELPRGTSGSK
ncbi:MAG: hypothetical protein LQ338_003249 [Usnochroma carphineum]|nr:MAG: hypothetical protein LQ338_003249 [Usnochroma carphineum]